MRISPFLFLLPWTAAAFSAQVETGLSPIFDHDEVSCMSSDDFPVVEAVVDPAEASLLREAQVYFKSANAEAWYIVDMEPAEGTRLRALLPKPLPETGRVEYYLFFLTGSFGTSQTEEISARVSPAGCGRNREPMVSSPALTLRATVPNQPTIPPGFQPHGISGLMTTAGNTVSVGSAAGASGGGLSGAAIGAIVGGGAAAAAGTAVVVGGGNDENEGAGASTSTSESAAGGSTSTGSSASSPGPSPTPAPAPAPPPSPSVPDVSGTWHMRKLIMETCYPPDLGRTSERLMAFQQNGTMLTATFVQTSNVGNFNGRIDSSGNVTLDGRILDNEGATSDFHMEGSTTTGSDMTGTYQQVYLGGDCVVRGTFTGMKTSAARTYR